VVERGVEVVEEMPLVGEAIQCSNGSKGPQVLRSRAFDENGDVARLEFGDDLAERVGARGVEHLNVGKTQDHDSNVGDCGELGQEPLRGAEEKCSVEAIGHDVLVQESLFVVGVDRHIDWRGNRRRRPRHVSQGEDRRDGDADFDSEDEE